MKTRQATIYNCDYCNKRLLHKGYMERHEEECFANPKNLRPCFSCGYQERVEVKFYTGIDTYHGSEPIYKATHGFKCTLKDKLLIPPKTRFKESRSIGEIDFVQYEGSEREQYAMPRDCFEFTSDPFPYGIRPT